MAITKQASLPTHAPLVLLVEDNIITLNLVEIIVTQAKCRFMSATNGEQALELAKTIHFELIITDIGLPGISGTELAALIREWEKSLNKEAVPIIGLTAHTLPESQAVELHMNKVLSKPIYLDEMRSLIFQFTKT